MLEASSPGYRNNGSCKNHLDRIYPIFISPTKTNIGIGPQWAAFDL